MSEQRCSCGSEVARVEVRVIARCARGHFVSNDVQPATVQSSLLVEPVTPGQIRALNGKAQALDGLLDLPPGQSKKMALAAAGVASTHDLDSAAMSLLLDRLEGQLAAARTTSG
jgi:hypothetical protein